MMTEVKRPVGRPPKIKDIHELWEQQQLANIEFAADLLSFAKEQLTALREEVKQVAGVKQRLEVMKAVNTVTAEFVKLVRASMADAAKKPENNDDKPFDLDAFLKEQS